MLEDDDDQNFWRQMVQRVWSRADQKAGASLAREASPVQRPLPAPVAVAPGPLLAGGSRLRLGSSGGLGVSGSDADWRSLIAAHWDEVGKAPDVRAAAPPAAEVVPAAAACSGPAPTLIEIEDEEDDAEPGEGEVDAEALAQAEAEGAAAEAQEPAAGLAGAVGGGALPASAAAAGEGASAPEPPAADAEGGADSAQSGRPGAEFHSALNDLPDEVGAAREAPAGRVPAPAGRVLAPAARAPAAAARGTAPVSKAGVAAAKACRPSPKAPAAQQLRRSAPEPAPAGDAGSPKEAPRHYLVDNTLLQAKTYGLGYRCSKRADDLDSSTAVWGSSVAGFDEGDGWLRVGDKYLPMECAGTRVLSPKLALARTTSGFLFAPHAPEEVPTATKPAGLLIRRSSSFNGEAPGGGLQRQPSCGGAAPAGLFVPRSSGQLKRQSSEPGGQPAEKAARQEAPLAATDTEGRRYDLNVIVVNFANVGATYACKVLGRKKERGDRLFDWEGVRRCVRHLSEELGLQVIGVVMENFWAPDNSRDYKIGIPEDIRAICESIEETPRLQGKNHKSCDDEMTIKCAYRRNCRFMDNDNYRDWIKEMRNDRCRSWLGNCQEMLQMRYFFDSQLGTFDTLDGKVPAGLLAPQKAP